MKKASKNGWSGWSKLLQLIACLAFLAGVSAQAQDRTLTNLDQLAQEAFSPYHSFYWPWTPWQWRAYLFDGYQPWWLDFSQSPGLAATLQTCTDSSMTTQILGTVVYRVQLTRDVLSGETLLQSLCATDIVATMAAPSDYQPGDQSENTWVWNSWLEATNCPDCWGLTSEMPPPTVTLVVFLADLNDQGAYQSNMDAQAEMSANQDANPPDGSDDTGNGFSPDSSQQPCPITNDAAPFFITSLSQDTNFFTSLVFPSCNEHIYVVQSTSSLTPTSSWSDVAWMYGGINTTTWTDTNTVGQLQQFYRVVRANPTNTNWGIPYSWAVTNGLDPLNPNLALENPKGDGFSNLEKYLLGLNPNQYTNAPAGGSVTTIRYYYDQDGRLTSSFVSTAGAMTYTVTPGHNLQTDMELHR